jgi:hypothetical protein
MVSHTMCNISSVADGQRRFLDLLGEACALTGLSFDDVEAHGNIVIDEVAIGLAYCGALDPGAMIAMIDLGAPPPGEAARIYGLLLQCNLLVSSLNAMFVVLPESDRCALTSKLRMRCADEVSGKALVEWLAGFASAYRAAAPALKDAQALNGAWCRHH